MPEKLAKTLIKDVVDSLKKEALILNVAAGILLLAFVFWLSH